MRSSQRVSRHIAQRGFTLVELMVSIGIFALMTALVVVKYGTFNQSVLLTNLAYDVALTVRTSQTYGLSVKAASDSGSSYSSPTYAYGVNIGTTGNTQFTLYADLNSDLSYDSGEEISTYSIKRGAVVNRVCADYGNDCTLGTNTLDILFKRPDPQAIICVGTTCDYDVAKIELKATDGNVRTVVVRRNGQISVPD